MTQKAGKRRIKNREKIHDALELRKGGATYEQIAHALGLKAKSHAHMLVMAGLQEINENLAEKAVEVRTMEIERLDAQHLALWPNRKNPRVADTLLRIQERRASLLGLDAPKKIAETDSMGNDLEDSAKARLRARMLASAADELPVADPDADSHP